MDILLVEKLAADALAWLHARYSVETRPELAADPDALRKAIYKAEAVVLPRKVPVGTQLLNWAPRLRVVGRMHEGTDNTDLLACRERGVKVIDPGVATVRSNAEYLLASLLLLYRRGIGAALAGERHAPLSLGRELHGSTVGIFGLAPTAHALALTLTLFYLCVCLLAARARGCLGLRSLVLSVCGAAERGQRAHQERQEHPDDDPA